MTNEVKTVLIIDDDQNITRTFARILQKKGYQVDTAENGKEAIQKTQNRRYHAVVTDICLPDINGVDLLDLLCDHGYKMVKIVITGNPNMLEQKKSANNADAYLLKPVKPEELLALLNNKMGVAP
jgi:two-component system, response regulator YesN